MSVLLQLLALLQVPREAEPYDSYAKGRYSDFKMERMTAASRAKPRWQCQHGVCEAKAGEFGYCERHDFYDPPG